MFRSRFTLSASAVAAQLVLGLLATAAHAQIHQTATLTPLAPASELPFRIELRQVDTGAMQLPTLHSFAAAQYDGKWVLFGGRTNGLHGFESTGSANFPTQSQNRDVWVIDPVTRQTWHRSLTDPSSGLNAAAIASLSVANTESIQRGDNFYMVGGYGERAGGGTGTLNTLTAISLPGMVNWAMGGSGTAATSVRQTTDAAFAVTGGGLVESNGRMQLVFGQNFTGGYTPGRTGEYTRQVRSFDIVDNGTTVSAANWSMSTPNDAFRRRDLNVVPVVRPDGHGGTTTGASAMSGVFTLDNGAWTVPVDIDANGVPTMADPSAAGTFKQGFNGYEAANLGLFSKATGAMHTVLFGGISVQYLDPVTGQVVTDDNLPFVNDVTAVSIDANGQYSQHHLGFFPTVLDSTGKQLRFGANAKFFANEALSMYDNGVFDLDALGGTTSLGFIYGGIESNSPHTRGVPGAISGASNLMFEVVLVAVPEPSAALLLLAGGSFIAMRLRRQRRSAQGPAA